MTKYDDEYWAKLPSNVQAAAAVLGYDQNSWDNDGSPPACDMEWAQLSPEQQAAATTLGYTPASWDAESDSDSDSD